MSTPGKVCLIAIDGWGWKEETQGNAVAEAKAPTMNSFEHNSNLFHSKIEAHGLAVGLPPGIMGNSEVGHLTMGAGRVSYQDLVRINTSMKDGSFKKNKNLLATIAHAKQANGRMHLLGLGSDAGVHSHLNHLFALLEVCKAHGVRETFVHFHGDGRDTPPTSSPKYIKMVQAKMDELNYGKIGTVIGRYYAMDRDKRWERVKVAYEAITAGIGEKTTKDGLLDVVAARAAKGENDEFLKPIIVDSNATIGDNDTVLFTNFRADRMREMVQALSSKPFETEHRPKNLKIVTFTQYAPAFTFPVIFPPQSMKNGLGEWISAQNINQYHCAETEKYAHVTFFFNGGQEKPFPGEERGLVESPKVATYDLQPEMNVMGVADLLEKAISSDKYPFVMCNFAPPDMVGHTGKYEETVRAVEITDKAVARVQAVCQKYGYSLVVTADHGNAEEMTDPEGKVKTSHSANLIPLNIAPAPGLDVVLAPDWLGHTGGLCDVAPTVLALMGLAQPKEMTGKSMVRVNKRVSKL